MKKDYKSIYNIALSFIILYFIALFWFISVRIFHWDFILYILPSIYKLQFYLTFEISIGIALFVLNIFNVINADKLFNKTGFILCIVGFFVPIVALVGAFFIYFNK